MGIEDLKKQFETEEPELPASSMEEMDNLVKEMQLARDRYDEAKEASNKLHGDWDSLKAKVVASLKAVGKTKYSVDGVGTTYLINKYSVKMPKGLSEKQSLFNFIREQGGVEALMSFTTIHHQTLNAWYNEVMDKDPDVQIPGIEEPTHEESLGFRTERKK